MKKIICMILILTMVIGCFGGCGSKSGEADSSDAGKGTSGEASTGNKVSEGEAASASEAEAMLKNIYSGELERNVTIRVLENDTAIEQGYFKELIEAFNAKYAEYGIVAVDANMDQYSNLADDGPYGYGPDILYQANDIIMKYVEGKHIYPIPAESLECFAEIPENAWEPYKADVNGTEYYMGVPVNVQSSMLYYRKDLLPADWETEWDDDKNNIPDMIESWNSMYRYSKQLKEEGNGRFGYMRSIYDVYFSSGFLFSYGAYVFGNNNRDNKDIGFSAGNAVTGANILLKQAELMDEGCIDDSITVGAPSKMAEGLYFATMTTPDVYTLYLNQLIRVYENNGMSSAEAEALAKENLVMTDVPKLPASGDLTEENPELIPLKAMGGVNGYAISSYTKAPNACLAFIEFATGYENVMKRHELLGIVPARKDAANAIGGITEVMFKNLNEGNIVIMPSISAVEQIWTPAQTFFQDIAKDAFRTDDKKYTTDESIKAALENVDKQIYDAIHTLSTE